MTGSDNADRILVVDVGTSGVRAAIVGQDARLTNIHAVPVLPASPAPGLVEVDPMAIADAVLHVAGAALAAGGPVAGVGIANQRATTVVWDKTTGLPVAPGIGWQDLRTIITCLTLQSDGFRLAPNMSATKVKSILDAEDPEQDRRQNWCFGTIDSWVAWTLAGGNGLHVTDATNAGVTGLVDAETIAWDEHVLERLGIPISMMPKIVDSSGVVGEAQALPGAPVICGIAGDQQASLVGQGCTRPGQAKATFGTGGMLDLCTGPRRPGTPVRGEKGTFSIVTWQRDGVPSWGVEAVMLSAGSCIEWLRDDLGIISTAAESATVAASSGGAADVWFVPALLGMGTPDWDFGARGTLLGLTRGTTRADIVRTVLRGIAHRGADLLDAAESDSGYEIASLRVDGGMSANPVFVQELADAVGKPIDVSAELEATTLGAGFLAGTAVGLWENLEAVGAAYSPRQRVDPAGTEVERGAARERWMEARSRALRTIPDLSGIAF